MGQCGVALINVQSLTVQRSKPELNRSSSIVVRKLICFSPDSAVEMDTLE